jgi:hypothetical protein
MLSIAGTPLSSAALGIEEHAAARVRIPDLADPAGQYAASDGCRRSIYRLRPA